MEPSVPLVFPISPFLQLVLFALMIPNSPTTVLLMTIPLSHVLLVLTTKYLKMMVLMVTFQRLVKPVELPTALSLLLMEVIRLLVLLV